MASTEQRTRPQDFVHYLDLTSTMRFFQQYKERTYTMLGDSDSGDGPVLDAGCGVGSDALALAELWPDAEVHGVDLDEALVAEAASRAPADGRVRFRTADVTALPYDDATFAACRADRVLVHVADAAAAVGELARVCRPGGVVLVSDPDYATLVIDSADGDLTARAVRAYLAGYANPHGAHRLPALLRRAGLSDVSVSADTFIVADHAVATQVFELPLIARRAVEAGVTDEAGAQAWLADLEQRSARGEFFAAVTGFAVRGVKPDAASVVRKETQ